MRFSKPVRLSVAFALLSLAASGCGGQGSTAGSQAQPGGAKAIKIAVVEPISGPYAENGQNSVNGAKLAVDQINAAGGIKSMGGAKLQLVVADIGGGDPTHAVDVTRQVIQQNPDLTAVLGLWSSAYTIPASAVTEAKHIPLLTESFSDTITSRGFKYVFQFPAKSSAFGKASFDYITALAAQQHYPLKKLAIVSENETEGMTVAKSIAALSSSHGIDVTGQEYFTPGLQDATSIATKVLATKPDLVFANGALNDTALLVKSLRGLGYTGPFLGLGNAYVVPDFYKATGQAGQGSFAAVAWNWDVPYPGAKEFNDQYTQKFNAPFAPQEGGELYAMVNTLKQAIETAGSADPTKVRDALAAVQVPQSVMVGGKVAFDATGMDTYTHPLLIEWLNGKPHIVSPSQDASTSAVFQFSTGGK